MCSFLSAQSQWQSCDWRETLRETRLRGRTCKSVMCGFHYFCCNFQSVTAGIHNKLNTWSLALRRVFFLSWRISSGLDMILLTLEFCCTDTSFCPCTKDLRFCGCWNLRRHFLFPLRAYSRWHEAGIQTESLWRWRTSSASTRYLFSNLSCTSSQPSESGWSGCIKESQETSQNTAVVTLSCAMRKMQEKIRPDTALDEDSTHADAFAKENPWMIFWNLSAIQKARNKQKHGMMLAPIKSLRPQCRASHHSLLLCTRIPFSTALSTSFVRRYHFAHIDLFFKASLCITFSALEPHAVQNASAATSALSFTQIKIFQRKARN